ncbi:MFS transporter [Seiridium cupressi]
MPTARDQVSLPSPKAPPRTGGQGRDIIDAVIGDTSVIGNLEPVAPTNSCPTEGAAPPSPQSPSHDHEPARSESAVKLSRAKTTLTMVSLCLSVLLSALDMTIVVTAVPAIVASLRSVTGYIWVGSAFTLGLTAVTPIWGSVADIWGRKPVILSALAIFLAASVICAVAPQMDALIVGRAIQRVGAAGMSVMVNTIICDMFSLRERGLYLAITSMVWAIGSAIGPILCSLSTPISSLASLLGVDALTSGLHILPLIVSCSLSAAGAGIYIQQTGKYRPIMYAAQVLLTLGVGLLINLEFEENLAKLFVFEILTGVGVGLNIEAPVIAAQAATTVRDTAAVVATMSFLRSITTGISVVVGGVMFQNQMNAENADLANTIGQKVSEQFNGGNATANVELISCLAPDQQVMVRHAYFKALGSVWIMLSPV